MADDPISGEAVADLDESQEIVVDDEEVDDVDEGEAYYTARTGNTNSPVSKSGTESSSYESVTENEKKSNAFINSLFLNKDRYEIPQINKPGLFVGGLGGRARLQSNQDLLKTKANWRSHNRSVLTKKKRLTPIGGADSKVRSRADFDSSDDDSSGDEVILLAYRNHLELQDPVNPLPLQPLGRHPHRSQAPRYRRENARSPGAGAEQPRQVDRERVADTLLNWASVKDLKEVELSVDDSGVESSREITEDSHMQAIDRATFPEQSRYFRQPLATASTESITRTGFDLPRNFPRQTSENYAVRFVKATSDTDNELASRNPSETSMNTMVSMLGKKSSETVLDTVDASASSSLEHALALAQKPFQNAKRLSIRHEIEQAVRHEKRRRIGAKVNHLNRNGLMNKAIDSTCTENESPMLEIRLGDFIKVVPEKDEVVPNLCDLTTAELSKMWEALANTKCKRIHWISYQPTTGAQLLQLANSCDDAYAGSRRLHLDHRDFKGRSYHAQRSGFIYTCLENAAVRGRKTRNLDKQGLNNFDVDIDAWKLRRAASTEMLGWKEGSDIQFMPLQRRRPAYLFMGVDIPRQVEDVQLSLSGLVGDSGTFSSRVITRGQHKLHFALVNRKLRFKSEPKWSFHVPNFGALDDTSMNGFIVQFKDEHKCAFASPPKQTQQQRVQQSMLGNAPVRSLSGETIGSSCSETCVTEGSTPRGENTEGADTAGVMVDSDGLWVAHGGMHNPNMPGLEAGTAVGEGAGFRGAASRNYLSLKIAIPDSDPLRTSTPVYDECTLESAAVDYLQLLSAEIDSVPPPITDKLPPPHVDFHLAHLVQEKLNLNVWPTSEDCQDVVFPFICGFVATGIALVVAHKIFTGLTGKGA